MSWSWRSPEQAAQRAAEREAHFVAIAREAHERARRNLGPQRLKPRDWEYEFGGVVDPRCEAQKDRCGASPPQAYKGSAPGRFRA